jgi:hypothetical protein
MCLNITLLAQQDAFSFKGKVYANGEKLKDARIVVLESGDSIYGTTSGSSGKFDFELQAEKQYIVEVSKEGFKTKHIWINTKGTGNLSFKVPAFAFDVYLKKDKVTPYDELSEIPVTLIKYQPEKKEFYMDKTYEEVIKNKKKELKEGGLQRR